MASIAGKRIVIIGGSSGIGQAVAAAVLSERGEVLIGSSQGRKIEEVKLRLGAGVDGTEVDVTREESIEGFFRQVGDFDHLVYTAGDWAHRNPLKISEVQAEDFSRALAVRFYGALLSVKHATSRIRDGGSVVLTDGIVAHMPRKGVPLATAMAGAIEHLVYGLAVDIAPIRVNAVCPGAIATAVWGQNAAEQFRSFTDPLPLPRMGTPEEVAEAYLYLMKCGYTTGQVVRVDGGRSLI
jgi:NAD(P)-dependent dehydrogenase (short-subunit alcohol dehydrogenase family)